MITGQKVLILCAAILFGFLFVAQTDRPNRIQRHENQLPAGDGSSLPLELLRPRYGEEPRFPQDYVIGTLGRCDASEESYRYAKLVVSGLASGNGKTEGVDFPEQKRLSVLQRISGLGTRSWRVGGGRVEPDGSVSYLIRFLGRENSVTGELYLRKEDPKPGGLAKLVTEKEPVTEPETKKNASTETGAKADDETGVSGKTDAETEAETDAGAGAETETIRKEAVFYWRVDDILLESPRSLSEGKFSPGGADMTAYERFF